MTAVFATCEPRATPALESAVAAGRQVAVVPLFLAPGLLLNAVRTAADRLGVVVAAPLGTLLAGLVLERYDQAVADWV